MEQEIETLPEVKPSSATTHEVPDSVKDLTFSVEDFEVEQLPEQGTDTTQKEGKAVEKIVPKQEKKNETKTTVESETIKEGDKTQEEPKLPKYLKPPKIEDKVNKEVKEIKPGATKAIVPSDKKSRDFSGFSREEAEVGRQMSNEAFDIFKKSIATRNDLTSLKDSSYLQHPQAYVLSPEFQEVRTSLTYAQREASYWEQQLVNMTEKGTDLVPLEGFDPRTGKEVVGQPVKSTKTLEERVRIMIGNCYQQAQQLQSRLQEFPTKYKDNISKDVANIEDFQKQQFGWENDAKLMDYSVNVEGLGDRTLKQIREDVYTILPKWAHSHPLAKLASNLVIALRIKQAELAELQGSQSVKKTIDNEQEAVEPSSRSKPSNSDKGELVHGIREFKIDPELM